MKNSQNIDYIKAKLGMQNLDVTEGEAKWLLEQETTLQKTHGDNPKTKPQAVANGAAVIVIAASLGVKFKSDVVIKQDLNSKTWQAATEIPSISLESVYKETATPRDAALAACIYFAGVAGELFTGNGHPLSGLELSGKAAQFACYLDRVNQVPPLTFWNRITSLCFEILAYNEDKYFDIFNYLNSNNIVKGCKDIELFNDIKPVNINQIFGALQ